MITWVPISARILKEEDNLIKKACDVKSKDSGINISKSQFIRFALIKQSKEIINRKEA